MPAMMVAMMKQEQQHTVSERKEPNRFYLLGRGEWLRVSEWWSNTAARASENNAESDSTTKLHNETTAAESIVWDSFARLDAGHHKSNAWHHFLESSPSSSSSSALKALEVGRGSRR